LPASASPTLRRRELGALLRNLRTERCWTVEQVAERLDFSPSKVSRLENGLRGVSARDIKDLCDLYNVHGEQRQQFIDLAAEGKRSAWWQTRNLPHSTYVGLEASASSISDFGVGVVPGLLQTADYARTVLMAVYPRLTAEEVEQRVASRIERQRLLTSDEPPRLNVVIDEAVLHRLGGNRRIMRAQLLHLLDASDLPAVTIRILPFQAGILPVVTNKFIILSFREPSVEGVVYVEGVVGLTADLYLGPREGLAVYQQAFGVMWSMAASPQQSRTMIAAIERALSD
jgi:transcriptional regulator with XRE-family HTH domain